MIRGINVLRLLSLATMLVVLAGCASTNAGSASGPASATASPTSQPSGNPSPSASAIVIDGLVRSTVNSLAVRDKPTTAGAWLGTIDTGQVGFVVAGPVSADGYAWYQLSGVGLPANAGCEPPLQTTPFTPCGDHQLGWVAAGQPGGQAWLEATTVPCPASPMNLEALVSEPGFGPLTALERLACYRSTPIRFRGWWPQLPPDAGLGGACGAVAPNPAWLICQGLYYNNLVISDSAEEVVGLKISIDPASGVTMPPRGQWVEVVAHLDDPAARDCTPLGGGEQDPVRVLLTCRSELVADSVEPVPGPY
jgi:hypothetical protein